MFRLTLIAALLATPALASAQTAPAAPAAQEQGQEQGQDQGSETGQPPQRIRSVTLGAGQKCPASSTGEIVVCSTLDQPYRIPKELRDDGPIAAQNQSWVNRAATADEVGRVAGGLPDTCSPVGTGGQSGCSQMRARAFAAERRAAATGQSDGR